MNLPVAERWFETKRLDATTTVLIEPHVHVLEQANMFLIEGRDRDVILDSGMGVAPLRPVLDALRAEPAKPLVHVASHAHIDHIGGVHEFDERLVHPAEADDMAEPKGIRSLRSADFSPETLQAFRDAGYPPLWDLLIDAVPWEGYDPEAYLLQGAPATGLLEEGDAVDLGDRVFEVLHLPGHSPGGIALWEPETGVLFAGDAIYDGPLIPFDAPVYARTLRRLRELPVSVVHGGHDPSFGRDRLREIVDACLPTLEAAAG